MGDAVADTPVAAALQAPSAAALRDELEEAVLRELLGPAQGPNEEIVDESPRERYLVGQLAPCRQHVKPEEQDELSEGGGEAGEEGTSEPTTTPAPTLLPSSIGLTFCLDADAAELEVSAAWGRYKRAQSEAFKTETGTPRRTWQRIPMEGRQVHVQRDISDPTRATVVSTRVVPSYEVSPQEIPSVPGVPLDIADARQYCKRRIRHGPDSNRSRLAALLSEGRVTA